MSSATWPSWPRSATRPCCTPSRRTISRTTAGRWPGSSSCPIAPASRCRRAHGGSAARSAARPRAASSLDHPEASQVASDGTRLPAACLNQPAYRDFCRGWADAALDAGVDLVFWDEPHWLVQACHCDVCGGAETSLTGFLGELVAHVSARGGRNTVCIKPCPSCRSRAPGTRWRRSRVSTFWRPTRTGSPSAARPSSSCANTPSALAVTARANGVSAQLWVPSFGLTAADIPDLTAAVAVARAAGIDDLWTWAFEAVRAHELARDAGCAASSGARSPPR